MIAIIAILVAIAIPAFTSQLERARVAVDMSNARAASSLAYSEYMLYHASISGSAGGAVTYTFGVDGSGNLLIMTHTGAGAESDGNDAGKDSGAVALKANSQKLGETELSVTVDDGRVTENTWLKALNGD